MSYSIVIAPQTGEPFSLLNGVPERVDHPIYYLPDLNLWLIHDYRDLERFITFTNANDGKPRWQEVDGPT
jgi:hypothetical protein